MEVGTDDLDDEISQLHILGNPAQGPGQHQDGTGHEHEFEAVDDGVHDFGNGHDFVGQGDARPGEGHVKSAPEQGLGRIGIPQGLDEGFVRSPAGPIETEEGHHHQNDDGQEKGDEHGLGVLGLPHFIGHVQHGFGPIAEGFPRGEHPLFRPGHGAEIPLAQQNDPHKKDGQDAIKVQGNAPHVAFKGGNPFNAGGIDARLDHADLEGDPVGDEEGGHGGGGGIHDVGQLFLGNLHLVKDIPEDIAHDGGVDVIVDEDDQSQDPCGDAGLVPGFNFALGPGTQGFGAPQAPDQGHPGPHEQVKEQQPGVPVIGHGTDDGLQGVGECGQGIAGRKNHPPGEDPQEKG